MQPKEALMTRNDMDAESLLLDQNHFELDAQGYAAFQEMVDNPPPTTARLHCTLTCRAQWDATAATGKSASEL